MASITVKDIMIPLAEYPTINEDFTIYEAVLALEEALKQSDMNYKHRAILVLDKNKDIVGKLSHIALMKGLESGYKNMKESISSLHTDFSPAFMKSMLEKYQLWEKPLDHLCGKAATRKIKDIMYVPSEGEYITKEETLDKAIHQIVMGQYQSLLVTSEGKTTGILRASDVFVHICNMIKTCQL
jgi:CBS domain-containing protein